jgi:hypothetical protein
VGLERQLDNKRSDRGRNKKEPRREVRRIGGNQKIGGLIRSPLMAYDSTHRCIVNNGFSCIAYEHFH